MSETTNNGQSEAYVHAELCNVEAHADMERQLAEANAALAEAVKGLTAISLYRTAPKSAAVFAHDTLARIEAFKVQPEVAQ